MNEIQLWENYVVYQETKQQRKAKQCKALLKEKEQEIEACEHNRYHMPQFAKQFYVIEEYYGIFYVKVCN